MAIAAPAFVVSPPEIFPFDPGAKADAPATVVEVATPANAIDLDAFVRDMQGSSDQAQAKYGAKPVVVKGRIDGLDEYKGRFLAHLKTPKDKAELGCYFAGAPESLWGKYADGQTVVVEGIPEYSDASAKLKNCRVIAQSPISVLSFSAAKLVRCWYIANEHYGYGFVKKPIAVRGEVAEVKPGKYPPTMLVVLKGLGKAGGS